MFRSDSFMKTTGLEEDDLEKGRRVHVSSSPSASATTSPSPTVTLSPRDSASTSSASASASPTVSVGQTVKEKKKVKAPSGKVAFVGKAGTAVVQFENGSTGIFPISELEVA